MQKQKKFLPVLFAVLLVSPIVGDIFIYADKVSAARALIFPVIGSSTFGNDYNAPRDGGTRTHHAIDIIANKGQKLVSVVNGTITDVQYPKPSWGYSVTIRDADGYRYSYLHINDDNPGTNDGRGGGMNAYAPDVEEGNRVAKGQLIGKVGDSGNANGVSHLHFEMYNPDGDRVNPYQSLVQARRISKPVSSYPQQTGEILPQPQTFRGGASVDVGNLDGDINKEMVVGPGKGGKFVKIYETNGSVKKVFMPSPSWFTGGADVAAGDVDNDGVDEIITGAGWGGRFVQIFEADGTEIASFKPFGDFRKGIRVAAGDVDNDGVDEIITGAGRGGGPRVGIFEPNGVRIDTFYAYPSDFRGGISVASGDISGDASEEVITGVSKGGSPRVSVFSTDGNRLKDFYAYDPSFRGGVKVESAEFDAGEPKEEILTIPATGGLSKIKMFAADESFLGYSDYFGEVWWRGPYDIGATDGTAYGTLGINRRTSIRPAVNF